MAKEYGINENDIAVVGFSAGSILCGEFLLKNDGAQLPSDLDNDYISDSIDYVLAEASAIGHIYSFYGRLSYRTTNVDTLKAGELSPTFYAFGTHNPFYNQFMQSADTYREAGVTVEEHIFERQPHGFGPGNQNLNWIPHRYIQKQLERTMKRMSFAILALVLCVACLLVFSA